MRAGVAAAALLAVAGLALIAPGEAARTSDVTVRLDPPLPAPPLPGVRGPESAPLVVIDAGHGGHDPGAVTIEGAREKDLTLALARALRDRLVAGGRVRVALTRADDRFLALPERSDFARRLGASLLLSLHADSAGLDRAAHGATLYILSDMASDAEAAALAVRENRADMVGGVNLGRRSAAVETILLDLAQRESLERATGFARRLHEAAEGVVPFRRDYLRRAALTVLKAPDVPAVLFETGYITNDDDRGLLDSAEGRARMIAALGSAIEAHLAAER